MNDHDSEGKGNYRRTRPYHKWPSTRELPPTQDKPCRGALAAIPIELEIVRYSGVPVGTIKTKGGRATGVGEYSGTVYENLASG